jgi:hypothetical protein
MKKFYLIRLVYDMGFWSEQKQDFVGFLLASRYEVDPRDMNNGALNFEAYNRARGEMARASSKKPIVIVECWENE